MQRVLLAFPILAMSASSPAQASNVLAGPVEASVVRVLDGDTFIADAHIWPGQWIRVSVRIRGIDAPEMKSRCLSERQQALQARERLEALLSGGHAILRDVGGGKFYGRVLARVATREDPEVAANLLAAGLVRTYHGGRRESDCPVPSRDNRQSR